MTLIVKGNSELTATNVNELFTRFVNYIDVKPKSVDTYAKAIRQFAYYLERNDITNPTRQDIINFREEVKQSHKPSTVQLYLTAVKLFFKWLDQEGIYKDVADKVKAPKQDKSHKKSYLTSEQCNKLLNDVSNTRDYAILTLMLTTGLRTIEVVRANVEDLSVIGNQAVLFIQGKGKDDKRDYVKLDVIVDEAIRDYLKTRGTNLKGEEPLFTSNSNHATNGGRLTTRSVSRIVKTSLVNSGFNSDRLTAHSLRHTTAHLNLENGATVEETKELLRHSNVATTYIYINEMNREKNNSEIRVANAIFRGNKNY